MVRDVCWGVLLAGGGVSFQLCLSVTSVSLLHFPLFIQSDSPVAELAFTHSFSSVFLFCSIKLR